MSTTEQAPWPLANLGCATPNLDKLAHVVRLLGEKPTISLQPGTDGRELWTVTRNYDVFWIGQGETLAKAISSLRKTCSAPPKELSELEAEAA